MASRMSWETTGKSGSKTLADIFGWWLGMDAVILFGSRWLDFMTQEVHMLPLQFYFPQIFP